MSVLRHFKTPLNTVKQCSSRAANNKPKDNREHNCNFNNRLASIHRYYLLFKILFTSSFFFLCLYKTFLLIDVLESDILFWEIILLLWFFDEIQSETVMQYHYDCSASYMVIRPQADSHHTQLQLNSVCLYC